jgi:3-hydroxyacyl-CoA dehydrogenase
MRKAGQAPIVMRREIDGFVMNRMQGALLEEAFRLVADGIASVEDVDIGLREGLALRWSFMGPFETIELNAPGGIADYCARYTGFYRRLQAEPAGPDVYGDDKVARILGEWGGTPGTDELAARTAWRDQRLAALRAHKRAQPPFPGCDAARSEA